jgi:hypothetical protein
MNLDVLSAEKLPEEPTQINVIQTTSGKYLPRNVRRSGVTVDSMDDMLGLRLVTLIASMGSELPLPMVRTNSEKTA